MELDASPLRIIHIVTWTPAVLFYGTVLVKSFVSIVVTRALRPGHRRGCTVIVRSLVSF